MDADALPQLLRKLRESRGLTLRDVERITEGRVSNAYLCQLENGQIKRPSAAALFQLSAAYAVDCIDLVRAALSGRRPVMDADARARELMGNLCGDAASWCFDHSPLCSCRPAIAAALREVEQQARREERERCAKVADKHTGWAPRSERWAVAAEIGAAIRALADERHDHCHSHQDGDCTWSECPQLRDGEPTKTGRSCPLIWPER